MKKVLVVTLALLIIMSTIFTGCGDNKQNVSKEQSKSVAKSEDEFLTETGTYPIVKDGYDVNMQIFTSQKVTTDSYSSDKNTFTKWLEDKTGVKYNFIVATSQEAKQKLNILMTSGEYPDIIMGGYFSTGEQTLYSKQGVLLPLNDLVKEQAINLNKIFEDEKNLSAKEDITLLDGKFYGLPSFYSCVHGLVTRKLWIYEPWLKSLDLDMPQTTNEFYKVLKTFKEKDPNQNNQQDEIPMAGAATGWDTQIDAFLMNAFIYNDNSKRMLVKDGQIDVTYNKDEWKEGLKYLNKLYEEDLIAHESLTMDETQLRALGENDETPILGCAPGGFTGSFTQLQGESGRWEEYVAVPPLEGPKGVRQAGIIRPYTSACYFITNRCKYPKTAIRVGDSFYDLDIYLRGTYGEKDVSWTYAEDGELGVDGEQGVFKTIVTLQKRPANDSWNQTVPNIPNIHSARVTDSKNEQILYDESINKYYPYAVNKDYLLPTIIFDEEAAAEVVELETTISNYITEMTARFISGDLDIESGWQTYLDDLENKGLKRYLELYQNAYDAKFK